VNRWGKKEEKEKEIFQIGGNFFRSEKLEKD
jgi:hypothetical protein